MISFVRRHLSDEMVYVAYLAVFGLVVVGFCVFVFVRALTVRPETAPYVAKGHTVALLEVVSGHAGDSDLDDGHFDRGYSSETPLAPPVQSLWTEAKLEPLPAVPARAATAPERESRPAVRLTPHLGEIAPLPPPRPAEIGSPGNPPIPVRRPEKSSAFGETDDRAVVRKPFGAVGEPRINSFSASARYDQYTAVYDLTAHTVYLPNGTRLEAHSGLGDRLDDPRYVNERDRGATPPHLYELTPREVAFHGVQALRLNPVGGEADIFGRSGLLAHTYMLGPNGDSNGCVSFKDYDAFLQAFQNGQVKRLAVVARLN